MRLRYKLAVALALLSCGTPGTEPTTATGVAEPTEKLPDGRFDRASAARALGVAGERLKDCGPAEGAGHALITFQADGTVASVKVDGGRLVGTPVGTCVEQHFRQIRIRPYDGGPVKVGKSFRLWTGGLRGNVEDTRTEKRDEPDRHLRRAPPRARERHADGVSRVGKPGAPTFAPRPSGAISLRTSKSYRAPPRRRRGPRTSLPFRRWGSRAFLHPRDHGDPEEA